MKILYFIMLATLVGCIGTPKTNSNFTMQPENLSDITINSLIIDSLNLEHVKSSYIGSSGIWHDGSIYFIDNYLCYMYFFNSSGELISRKLGKGRSKQEVITERIQGHTVLKNNELYLFDASGLNMIYDSTLNLKSTFRFVYNDNFDRDRIYEDPFAYTYRYNDIVCRSSKESVFINVYLAHLTHNMITTQNQHLDKNCNILEINTRQEKFGRLLAKGYPNSYQLNTNRKAILSSVNYDIDDLGNFYVNYESDSLIYVYNSKYEPTSCFGCAGVNMDLNYTETKTPQDVGRYYREERNTKGYYNWLEYEPQNNLLFRSYTKGKHSQYDGLQIYCNKTLIGDIDVPKHLKVMGYIEPYFYSYIVTDNKNEYMKIYRFKI